eukprot:GEMP01004137.1.p1 GENE.GEMP01004137.1~~GEMP01004137.1.p1  ORF type:complete len:1387 (+),score=280.95 GEMP01004137.1:86-4246(+)
MRDFVKERLGPLVGLRVWLHTEHNEFTRGVIRNATNRQVTVLLDDGRLLTADAANVYECPEIRADVDCATALPVVNKATVWDLCMRKMRAGECLWAGSYRTLLVPGTIEDVRATHEDADPEAQDEDSANAKMPHPRTVCEELAGKYMKAILLFGTGKSCKMHLNAYICSTFSTGADAKKLAVIFPMLQGFAHPPDYVSDDGEPLGTVSTITFPPGTDAISFDIRAFGSFTRRDVDKMIVALKPRLADADQLQALKDGLSAIQVPLKEVQSLINAISALWDIEWQRTVDNSDIRGLVPTDPAAFAKLAKQLGIPQDELSQAMSMSATKFGEEARSPIEAVEMQKTLSVYLYQSLYAHLCNVASNVLSNTEARHVEEDVAANSVMVVNPPCFMHGVAEGQLSALLRNYCNDRMQHYCGGALFMHNIDALNAEGLHLRVNYDDVVSTLSVVDSKASVFCALEEACIIPRHTPQSLHDRILQQCDGHVKFAHPDKLSFTITHAGGARATYSSNHFLVDNQGRVSLNIYRTLQKSKAPLIKALTNMDTRAFSDINLPQCLAHVQLKRQVDDIERELVARACTFIFCLDSDSVDVDLDRFQVLEMLSLTLESYPVRLSYYRFLKKYHLIAKRNPPKEEAMGKGACLTILQDNNIPSAHFAFPQSAGRVYLQLGAFHALNAKQSELLAYLRPRIVRMQTLFRCLPYTRQFYSQRRRCIAIQSLIRRRMGLLDYYDVMANRAAFFTAACVLRLLLKEQQSNKAATLIQATHRMSTQRHKYKFDISEYRVHKAATRIQSHVRRLFAMRDADSLRLMRLRHFAARLIQSAILRFHAMRTLQNATAEAFLNQRKSGLRLIQLKWRQRAEQQRFDKLRGLRVLVLRTKYLFKIYTEKIIRIQACVRRFLWCKNNMDIVQLLHEIRVTIAKHFYYYRSARTVQRYWRGYLARVDYRKLVTAAIVCQAFLRTKLWRMWWLNATKSAATVQKNWRKWFISETERTLAEKRVEERIVGLSFGQVDILHVQSFDDNNAWLQGLRSLTQEAYRVLTLAVGATYSLAIAEGPHEPELFMWAVNGTGLRWIGLPGLSTGYVIQVACGANHFAVRTVDGLVFTWGDSNYGQCGRTVRSLEPWKLDLTFPATHVACGPVSTGLVLQNGWAMVCGQDVTGKRGDGKVTSVARVSALPPVLEILCGEKFYIARTRDGDVFSWGFSDMGQLGKGSKIPQLCNPSHVDRAVGFVYEQLPPILQISIGNTHCCVLTADKEVGLWGTFSVFDSRGSLGRPLRRILSPTLVDHAQLKKTRLVACSAEGMLVIVDKMCYSFQMVKLAPTSLCLIPSMKEYALRRRPESLRSDFSTSVSVAWTETMETSSDNNDPAASDSLYKSSDWRRYRMEREKA